MLYKHYGDESYSSNKLVDSVVVSGQFFLKSKYDFLGEIDRMFIAGIDKNTKKCVFLREFDLKNNILEKKVSLDAEYDVNIFINFKSRAKVWVDFEKFGIVENGSYRSFVKAEEGTCVKSPVKKIVDSTPSPTSLGEPCKKKIIARHSVEAGKIYKYSCQSILKSHEKIMLEGFDVDGTRILRRNIETQKSYNTIFQTSLDTREIILKVNDEVDLDLIIDDVSLIGDSFKPVEPLSNESVVACMATYPARRHIFLDTVDTILNQVDRLYIYLNNYDEVPSEILEHKDSKKIEYILDPSSHFRASAKFSWLSSINCYVVTIDDDILYPSDYVKKLVECSKKYNDEAVIGVHGSIFKAYVKDASKCRKSVFNFQSGLDVDTEVHMLGSGTTLFPPKVLKFIDSGLLLNHPLANDELLAINMRNESIKMISLHRKEKWMEGHPDMDFGIFEEKQLNGSIKTEVSKIVSMHNPWPSIPDVKV
ncbi:hypothetical protein ACU6U9_00765 [Pseudomonas sp. HK3]|jgi:hypothetical protein